MSDRRQSRELALQVLFQKGFQPQMDFMAGLKMFKDNFQVADDVWRYAQAVLLTYQKNQAQVDQLIRSLALHWSVERMAQVDLNILRVAITELKFLEEQPPAKVVVNEAIEIAKKYSSSDSHTFVNAILDRALKT